MDDAALDPKIIARFLEASPPYLGVNYVRLAQEIRDEAVADIDAERGRLRAVVDAWNEMAMLAAIVPGTIDHRVTILGAPADVEAFRAAARVIHDALGEAIDG